MQIMIIACSGKIQSGKDTVGNIIQYLTSGEMGIHSLKKSHAISESLTYEKYSKGFKSMYYLPSNWKVRKFAYKLKQVVSILTGCSIEDLESQEFKSKQMGEEWNWFEGLEEDSERRSIWTRLAVTNKAKKHLTFPNRIRPYTYREMLQRVGTEAMRNQIHENIWVNALFSDYVEDRGYSYGVEVVSSEEEKEKLKEAKNLFNNGIQGESFKIKLSKDSFPQSYNNGLPNWIITDLRFPNELKAIEERNGITIRINREWYTTVLDGQRIISKASPDAMQDKDYLKAKKHLSETSLDSSTFKYTIDNNGTIEELVEKVKEILILEKII